VADLSRSPLVPGRAWETFAHGADIGVRGSGPERERAFEAAAMGLTNVVTDPASVRPLERVDVACTAADDELPLYGWLNELITRLAVRRMLFARFQVRIAGDRLDGAAWG
jgi:tRNA nucleotidyltransferase (CCA-adding enzyme)